MKQFLATWALSVEFYFYVFAALTVAEILFARQAMSIATRLRGLAFWAFIIPIQVAVVLSASAALQGLGVGPVIQLDFGSAFWAPIAAIAGGLLIGDLSFYWMHRAQHRFFWRWHRVHHSIQNLSAINSYHHWSEPVFVAVFGMLPLAFVELGSPERLAFVATVLSIQPYFIHSPMRLHFGPLSKVLIDNRFHRIHHSLEPKHLERNFGAATPFWDWMFGTAYFPGKDEWPEVGVAGLNEPRTVAEWSSIPFQPPESPAGGQNLGGAGAVTKAPTAW